MTPYLAATGLVTLLVVVWLRERVLYVIFPWAYVQNFILCWMFTSGLAGRQLCQALLISKEFLLLWLFFYYVPRLGLRSHSRWLLPVRFLLFFTVWCVIRYMAAVIFQGGNLFGNLWDLRIVCFPFEVLVVGVGVMLAKPDFATRFIRRMVLIVAGLALVGILLDLLPGPWFWRDHVDFSTYNFYVKGRSIEGDTGPSDVLAEAAGVGTNGLGRTGFTFLSLFRAFGTVGDAVGFGHLLAFPLLLSAFWLRRTWRTRLMLAITAGALFLSLTRSAWIFVLMGFVYVMVRWRRYRPLLALGAIAVIGIAFWAPMAHWYSASLAGVSWTGSSEDPHAQGFIWLYKEGLWQFDNLLGQGLTAYIPEGGYGRLLIRYGWPALGSFVCFCISLYRELRQAPFDGKPLYLLAQAVPLVLLITLNFSFYPFSFIPYLLVWFVVGACLATASVTGRGALDARNRLFANLVGTQA